MLLPAFWDGGRTYQYFIYPEDARYERRDFDFRISSATIEKIPSDFTRFPGYHRHLMMLDNELEVIRNGQQERYEKQEIFKFDSADKVQSFSFGNDFNLMISKASEVFSLKITEGEISGNKGLAFVFALDAVLLRINNEVHELLQNDCILIRNPERQQYLIQSDRMLFGVRG